MSLLGKRWSYRRRMTNERETYHCEQTKLYSPMKFTVEGSENNNCILLQSEMCLGTQQLETLKFWSNVITIYGMSKENIIMLVDSSRQWTKV